MARSVRSALGLAAGKAFNFRGSENLLQNMPEGKSLWQFMYQEDVHMPEVAWVC